MTDRPNPAFDPRVPLARGRWLVFAAGAECGDETWTLERGAGGALRARGEQTTRAPHPFPSVLAWRADTSPDGRVVALQVRWRVGEREVVAEHRAEGERWSATIDVGGHVRAQQGDYPPGCEVLLATHGVHALALRRYVLEPGAEHAFGALVVGPPWMAVEPGRHVVRCTEAGERESPLGRVRVRRVEVSDPDRGPEASWSAWLDPHDIVLESFEDPSGRLPWMRLVEYERFAAAPGR